MPAKNLEPEQLAQTFDWLEANVLNHPEYGKEVKKILKKVDPRVSFPEIDLEDRVEAATAAQKKELDDFKASLKEKENKEYWQGERKKAKEKYELSDEDLPKIEKFMTDEHVLNYDVAARHYSDTMRASAEPTNYHDVSGVQLPSNDGLFPNPIKWSRDEAYKFINERNRERRSS